MSQQLGDMSLVKDKNPQKLELEQGVLFRHFSSFNFMITLASM
jgi:hypothetical protein